MNAPTRAPALFTDAEFERLVRSGGFGDARVELRRGMIVKMNAQYVPHGTIKRKLARQIETALSQGGLNWIVDQEISVAFGGGFEPLPDIIVWEPASAPTNLSGAIPAAAVKLIVEVSDTTLSDDLGEKLEDYARGGLAEYWVADVQGKLILRHADPAETGYARREPVRFGEAAPLLTLPNVVVETSALSG